MRREVLTILSITLVVLVAVFVLGPALAKIQFGKPEPTPSVPIPSTENDASGDRHEERGEPLGPLVFEVRDSVTGERIESGTLIEISAGNDFHDLSAGARSGEGIDFEIPPVRRPISATIRRYGYVTRHIPGFALEPGERKLIRFSLTPLFRVSIQLAIVGGEKPHAVRVMGTEVPQDVRTLPFNEWQYISGNEYIFMLAPGKYLLQVPQGNPLLHPDLPGNGNWLTTNQLSRYVSFPTSVVSEFFPFEVVDRELTLRPTVEAQPSTRLSGMARDISGNALANVPVSAIRMGPGPIKELVAMETTADDGSFAFDVLEPGTYLIESRHQQRLMAFAFAEIVAGAEPDILVLTSIDRPLPNGVTIKLPKPTSSPSGPEPPESPPARPQLPRVPRVFSWRNLAREVTLTVNGATTEQLWNAVVRVVGPEQDELGTALEYLWNREALQVALVEEIQQPRLVIEYEWCDAIKLEVHVPGFEVAAWELTRGAGNELELACDLVPVD